MMQYTVKLDHPDAVTKRQSVLQTRWTFAFRESEETYSLYAHGNIGSHRPFFV
jgi:hypothetical protein